MSLDVVLLEEDRVKLKPEVWIVREVDSKELAIELDIDSHGRAGIQSPSKKPRWRATPMSMWLTKKSSCFLLQLFQDDPVPKVWRI